MWWQQGVRAIAENAETPADMCTALTSLFVTPAIRSVGRGAARVQRCNRATDEDPDHTLAEIDIADTALA